MRNAYSDALKVLFHDDLIKTKAAFDYTQAQMAERLLMDPRSYIDLDHGKNMASALTFVLYLACTCRDPYALLSDICTRFDGLEDPNIRTSQAFRQFLEAASRGVPAPVARLESFLNKNALALCPQCAAVLRRRGQQYCDHCGQALDWSSFP